jgi:transcriptional regulator with XRE-family HTH domain
MIQEKRGEYRTFTAAEFGELVKLFRLKNGWKQITLAYEARVTERTIQRIEKGEQVSDETRRQIAKAFRLPDDFFSKPGYVPSAEEVDSLIKETGEKFMAVAARPLQGARDFEEILNIGHAYLIDGSMLPDEMQEEVAAFKDTFHDWTWIFSEIGHVEQLRACRSLWEHANKIFGQEYRGFFAVYDAEKPSGFKILAMTFVPRERELLQLIVPRRIEDFQA